MKYFYFFIIFLLGEVVAYFIFKFIRHRFQRGPIAETSRNKWNTIAKGWLERFFIYMCMVNDLPHALTVFGALKLGTRLDTDKQQAVSNDYFLIGNIISIMLALGYYLVWQKWFQV